MKFLFLKEDYKRDLKNHNIKSDTINKAIIDAMDKDSEEDDVQAQFPEDETEQTSEETMGQEQPEESEMEEALNADELKKSLEDTGVELQESRKLTESVDDNFQAFLTNLGKYNEGELVGDWFDFPMDEDEFEEALESIGVGEAPYEEWFVTDYNDPLGHAYETLGEYTNLDALNEYAEFANNADNNAFAAVLDAQGDFESAKEIYESGDYAFYPNVSDWGELAEAVISEFGGVEQLDRDTAERYFDYEALGRDLSFDTYESEDDDGNEIELSAGEYWCGDENASDQEIGEAYVDNVGFDGVGNIEYYFDYDAYGRDLSFDNFTMTDYGVIEIY